MTLKISDLKIRKDTPVPLYYQLKQQILNSIVNNELKVDEQIPNEMEIMNGLEISRSTVRQAINELVSEGYLHRIKAKGTFVSKPKVDEGFFQKLESFNHEMLQKGLTPSTKVLALKTVEGIEHINNRLLLDPQEKLIYLSRIRYANDEPVVYLETYIPYSKFPELLSEDFENQSLYSLLEQKYNSRVVRATREIEATIATSQEKSLLKMNKNLAICLVKTVAYASGEIPVEYSVARYIGERNKFTVELVRK